ncbi:hypothetical protein HY78_00430 [Rhizorhabdus wittichii DC-6]|nr:hypothetical protein HY78_00430 [Rhizorhabdus wittichii DC-6]
MKRCLSCALVLASIGPAAAQGRSERIADQYARAKYEAELKRSGFELSIPIAADDPVAATAVRYADVVGDKTARLRGEYPRFGMVTEASSGDTIFTSFLYDVRIGAVTVADLKLQVGDESFDLPSGGRLRTLLAIDGRRPVTFCEEDGSAYARSGKRGSVCLVDQDFDYRFDIALGAAGGKDRPLPTPLAYRLQPRTIKAVRFRSELVFLGVAGGILRVGYREYVNELARPAFSTELTYDMSKSGPTTFRYRTVQVTVFEASNNGIRYRVDPI